MAIIPLWPDGAVEYSQLSVCLTDGNYLKEYLLTSSGLYDGQNDFFLVINVTKSFLKGNCPTRENITIKILNFKKLSGA